MTEFARCQQCGRTWVVKVGNIKCTYAFPPDGVRVCGGRLISLKHSDKRSRGSKTQ